MTGRLDTARRIVAIVGIALGASRCGGSPGKTPDAAATPDPAGAAASNACLLLDRDDMERVAKGKVTLLNNIEAPGQSNCEVYREDDSTHAVFILEAHWTGGKTLVQTEKGAVNLARQILNEKTVSLEPLLGSASARGPADEAFYSDVMPSWVLKGDVMLKFTMPGLPADEMQQTFVPVAGKALGRLP